MPASVEKTCESTYGTHALNGSLGRKMVSGVKSVKC